MPKRKRSSFSGYRYRKKGRFWKATKKASGTRIRKRNFTKAVKKLIRSTAEKKRVSSSASLYVFGLDGDGAPDATNSSMSQAVDLTQLFCDVPQGTNDGERIGEQIRVHSAKLKLLVRPPTGIEASVLRVWVGRYKATPGVRPTALNFLELLDTGSTTTGFNGTMLNMLYPNNTDAFTILATRTIKVGHSNAVGFVNNDFPSYRAVTIDLTKHLGVLKYAQSLVTTPTNKHLYLWMGWVNPDGTEPSSANPRVTYFMPVTYTDL